MGKLEVKEEGGLTGYLNYEEAKEFVRKVYAKGFVVFGIDGFEEEDGELVYVYTELVSVNDGVDEVLNYLWKLYQIGCRWFEMSYGSK